MLRTLLFLPGIAFGCLTAPASVAAQMAQPVAASPSRQQLDEVERAALARAALGDQTAHHSAGRFALVGAATGAVLTLAGIGIYVATSHESEGCLGCSMPVLITAATAAGAAIGALGGLVVYVAVTTPPSPSQPARAVQ